MKIIDFSVKRPVTMIILVTVIIIMGFFTLSKMAVDLIPDMKFPIAAVMTEYPGVGPEEVESQITKPLEGTLNTLGNIKEIHSMSTSGSSLILIYYNWGTNMDTSVNEIREKIGLIDKYLPSGSEKPVVLRMDPTLMPVIQIGIKSDTMSLGQLQEVAQDVVEPRLSRITEVASVVTTGGMQREVKVEVDPVKLANYNLSLGQVTQVLRAENFNMSAGQVKDGGRQYFLRSLQQFESVEDIKNVAIMTPTGGTVYINDIATVTDGFKDESQMTRVDGQAAVGIHCLKQSDANTVKTCKAVREELQEIEKELDLDLELKVVMDQSTYINQSLNTTKRVMIEGGLLAMLILFLFLRNLRSTLIIFTAIPLSIITTFILMYFNHDTINLITLGGLALGLGRMVDDSIVVFENIYRHRLLGLSAMDAAVTGASEVGRAVVASTLTLMAVFFPILLTEGLSSVLFKPLAITVMFAIFCSLMVALTVVPLMASRMLTDKSMAARDRGEGKLARITTGFGDWIDGLGERYKVLLQWALGHRRKVVIYVTLLMVGSLALIPLVGAEFMPAMDSGEISITVEGDKGSLLKETDKTIKRMEKELREIPEVDTIFASVGSSANMFMDSGVQSDNGTLYVKLVPRAERQRGVDVVSEEIRQRVSDIPGAKIKVTVMDMTANMGSAAGPINVQVRGDDLKVLREISDQAAEVIRKVPGTREITSSISDGNPEVQVRIDRTRAAAFGLTPGQVAAEIQNARQGTVATRYKVEGDEVDVRVRYSPEGYDEFSYIQNLGILSPSGAVVKLSQIATFDMEPGPIQITREDRVRKAEINGYLLNRDLNAVMTDIQAELGKINLPSGYTFEYGGEQKEMTESFASLGLALLLAIILVYAVMAILYESFFNPFVIMFSVPTAIIGVVLSLLLTGKHFSVVVFIGVIMLVGIVVANAIVLVDYLKQLRERGMERNAAIVEAGRVRLRPILMTALATILAMFPLSLGLGEGGEWNSPLAIVVIGGLLVSTLITLVLVPVVYSIFDDWGQKLSQRRNQPQVQTDSGESVEF
ncbi:Acriflavin resistance protein [Syntrophomonas zehnderi OL-4]|uniref:Acriflavin resistance protein n=1 Tax=Syntrophomonas zehnderi OL-4 TaxID=690567 RepID=A0A0E4GAG8_9FIRM|nr:efflux RND transporter permease subunit [Syntrophomonas zehnderi]CFX11940.1 Acriflavin resistance protein [Syntrophomonas zehnderi OL-4]